MSTQISTLFSAYGTAFQAATSQAVAFHNDLVAAVAVAADEYGTADVAIASSLKTFEQDVLNALNSPAQTLLGRPLIGDGVDGTPVLVRTAEPVDCGTAAAAMADPEA